MKNGCQLFEKTNWEGSALHLMCAQTLTSISVIDHEEKELPGPAQFGVGVPSGTPCTEKRHTPTLTVTRGLALSSVRCHMLQLRDGYSHDRTSILVIQPPTGTHTGPSQPPCHITTGTREGFCISSPGFSLENTIHPIVADTKAWVRQGWGPQGLCGGG